MFTNKPVRYFRVITWLFKNLNISNTPLIQLSFNMSFKQFKSFAAGAKIKRDFFSKGENYDREKHKKRMVNP
jgi:hypothetical protein